ncbi:MAG TPA: nucleoside-diphosphate kinase [Candidatus Latescibacteria bacterium]|nr:nucleoside-diphosphate kinase [Candidatus Latescibacterota bacterium]
MEATLLIIKPDAIARGVADHIIRRVENEGFKILARKRLRLLREEAEGLYAPHRGKPFFDDLVEFMTSGEVFALILQRERAVDGLRQLIGATDPAQAAEGTIRRQFGTSKTRNAVHASDSSESAQREIKFLFREGEWLAY